MIHTLVGRGLVAGLFAHATLAAVVIAYSIGLVDPAEMLAIRQVRTMEFRWAVAACVGVMVLNKAGRVFVELSA